MNLVNYKHSGGDKYYKIKILIKILGIVILFMLVWFREFFDNATDLLIRRSNFKTINFNVFDESGTM